jgi:putative DNA primase/helicase
VIPLIRKGTEEKVARYQSKENDQAAVLSAMIRRFVADRAAEIQLIDLTAPDLGNDRAIDNWTPLLAIASCGGDKWLKNAHEAAFELSRGDDEVPVILEEFICDVVAIFIKSKADFIATKDLIAALCAMEDKPWATYGRSHHSITIHDLGKLMREAKVRVGAQKHDQDGNRRGFYRKDVEHLFDGYGPAA